MGTRCSGQCWFQCFHPRARCFSFQLQGPKSGMIMEKLFGKSIKDLKYYWLRELELEGIPLVVSRTGWSSELGYELYLRDGSKGDQLWELIMNAGKEFGLQPGHTSSIRRIEGGMLSYHADADIDTNPFEVGLDRLVALESDINFIGKKALQKIHEERIKRIQVGLEIFGDPLQGPNTIFWPIQMDGKNIALAMIDVAANKLGQSVNVVIDENIRNGVVVEKPFYDPKKSLAST